jgi:hypothetical protein
MLKKSILSLVCVFVLAGLFTSGVLAQSPQPPARQAARRGWGEITSSQEGQLVLQNRQGTFTLELNEDTRVLAGSIGDLVAGRQIVYTGAAQASGSVLARLVVLLPEDFNRLSFREKSGLGEVWATDLANSTLTLHTRGVERVYQVTSATTFSSIGDWLHGLVDLPVHQRVLVIGEQAADGTLLATRIAAARPQRIRFAGKITRIDQAAQQLTLQSLDGRSLNFTLDENTLIEAPDHTQYTLADLASGTPALVVATFGSGPNPLAVRIVVRLKTNL